MKSASLALLLLLGTAWRTSVAQTPFATINNGMRARPADDSQSITAWRARAMSANNPWLGSQIGYRFTSGDMTDNLLVSARLIYNIDLGVAKLFVPVMGNISELVDIATSKDSAANVQARAQELLNSTQGVNVGIYPFYKLIEKPTLTLVLHGAASWKLNALKTPRDTADTLVYLHQGRLSIGVEAGFGKRSDGNMPLTLSLAPVWTLVSSSAYQRVFGEAKSSLWSFEMTAVVPIKAGVGVMIEGIFAGQSRSVMRAGILFSRQLGEGN